MLRSFACGFLVLTWAACTAPPEGSSAWMPAPAKRAAELPEKPGDPGWRVLTAIPECDAYIAVDPAALGPTLTWRPCASGVTGCSELAPLAEAAPGQPDVTLLAASTARGVQVVVVERGGPRQRVSLAPLDGPPFLVFDLKGEDGACRFVHALFAANSAAVMFAREAGGKAQETVYFAGPLRADDSWHRPAAREPVGERFAVADAMSLAGRTIVQANEDFGVRRSDPETGRFGPVLPAEGARAGFAFGTSIVFASKKTISVSTRPDRPPVVLHEAVSGHILGPLRREGDTFYWVEGSHDLVGKPTGALDYRELWMANATDDFRRFEPRSVADSDIDGQGGRRGHSMGTMRVGGTMLAYAYEDYDPDAKTYKGCVVVKDVITHERRILRSGPEGLKDILFVDAEELGVEVRAAEGTRYRRLRIDALERL